MKTLLIGERYRDLLENPLKLQGFRPIWLPDNPKIDKRLAGHTDLNAFYGRGELYLAEHLYCIPEIVKEITNGARKIRKSEVCGMHPNDAVLCAAELGGKLLHKASVTEPRLLALYATEFISVKQAYARCAVCCVRSDAIITADGGIAKAAERLGTDVLHIAPGGFCLEGFREGFIGGSSFTDFADSKVYFTGTLAQCTDADRILAFMQKHGTQPVFLTDRPAFDIGSAILL